MKKIGIIGATGYAGAEIARIILRHPLVKLEAVSSVSFEGEDLSDVYPNFFGLLEDKLTDDKTVVEKSDVVFASLPHGLSEELAQLCCQQDKIFIDMGADFRLHSEEDYQTWYGGNFENKSLHQQAVYALPELFREQIKTARLIANPGCYVTSVLLGLAPLMKNKWIQPDVIIDAKSGVTGAGRGLTQNTHYPECNEAFSAYKIAQHRHTPEIEQTLSLLAKQPVMITFVPHLLPVNRGILSTMYTSPTNPHSLEEIHALYCEFYQDEYFVRVLPLGSTANLKNVKYSNYCDISLHQDSRTGRIIVIAVLDNMVKGAAGQAVQNMNLCCGFPEETALDFIPPAF